MAVLATGAREVKAMHITYVSGAMEKQSFNDLFKDSKQVPGQQAQKFNRLMIEGIGRNGVLVTALSGIPVTPKNHSKKFFASRKIKGENVTWHYPSTLNVGKIKNLWQMSAVFLHTLKACFKKESAVVFDVLNASVAYGAVLAGRLMRRPCIGIVTDLPHLMVTGTSPKHTRLVNKVIDKCTGYVLLTEAMNGEVNPKGKPYVIIEGACDVDMEQTEAPNLKDSKICMYAGFLDARYGAKAMVDAFVEACVPTAELHLYGSGPYVAELEETVKKNHNVVYHGTVMNDEIVKAELSATLLINPRPTHEDFTKYSFPSKNMEYMVSGTPVLTTKLPGMPEEYYPFVYLLEDESVSGMAKALSDVLSRPASELFEMGSSAKRFVLEEKSNVSQTKKLLNMLEKLI